MDRRDRPTASDIGQGDAGSSSDGSDGPIARPLAWVLLYGDRRAMTLLLSAGILVTLLVVGTVWEFEMERLVTETRAVQTLFNTLLGGIILFVSVVLSINTAALSQEFAPLQVKLAHIEDSIQFRMDVEELVDQGISPAGLKPFLEYLLGSIRSEITALRAAESQTESERTRRALRTFLRDIDVELSKIEARLGRTDLRLSSVLLSTLDYPYARHINAARRLEVRHGGELQEPDIESLDALLRSLTILASGREYYTTLHFKRVLRNMSSNLLVLSLPVIVFTSFVLLAIDAGLFPRGTLPGVSSRLFYVVLAFVIALSPYVLLSSYMLRILTVSRHSLEGTAFSVEPDDEVSFDE